VGLSRKVDNRLFEVDVNRVVTTVKTVAHFRPIIEFVPLQVFANSANISETFGSQLALNKLLTKFIQDIFLTKLDIEQSFAHLFHSVRRPRIDRYKTS
jgi:hypothetical protein